MMPHIVWITGLVLLAAAMVPISWVILDEVRLMWADWRTKRTLDRATRTLQREDDSGMGQFELMTSLPKTDQMFFDAAGIKRIPMVIGVDPASREGDASAMVIGKRTAAGDLELETLKSWRNPMHW